MARPTINDVARLAGVSKKTVSRVINHSPLLSDATRSRVEKVIADLGYVPDPQARGLALGRSMLVALVHDGSFDDHLLDVQSGLCDALPDNSYTLGLKRIDPTDRSNLADFLSRHRPFAVILTPPLADIDPLAALCDEAQTPVIRLGIDHTGPSTEREAMANVVNALVAMGHRRIALVAGPETDRCARERELGYLDAMAEHGLDRGPALIEEGDMTCESGRSAGSLLLQVSPCPTAIIAVNDAMAAGVVQAATKHGLPVPQGLSVVGFGDSAFAGKLSPPLTTVRTDWRATASQALQAVLLGEAALPAPRPQLVERGTVAPPA